MKRLIIGAAALLLVTTSASAQFGNLSMEVRPFAGAAIPVGDQSDLFDAGLLLGVQGAVWWSPRLRIVGTFAWSPATSRYDVSEDGVDLFLYDAGVEYRLADQVGGWRVSPFVGAGIGGRTYIYDSDQLGNGMCLSGYGAVGTQLQFGRTGARVEARGNVFCYESPFQENASATRADIGLLAALTYRFR